MKVLATSLATALISLTSLPVDAGGLICKLPDDGAWARYRMGINDNNGERMYDVTVSSVGTATVDGEPCRWIECHIESQAGTEDRQQKSELHKLLIREKDFGKTSASPRPIVRGWLKEGDQVVQPASAGMEKFWEFAFLRNQPKGVETVAEERNIDWQRGRLTCKTVERESVKTSETPEAKPFGTWIVWPHQDVPFGAAASRLDATLRRDGMERKVVGAITFELVDFGTGAKSALPDSN